MIIEICDFVWKKSDGETFVSIAMNDLFKQTHQSCIHSEEGFGYSEELFIPPLIRTLCTVNGSLNHSYKLT